MKAEKTLIMIALILTSSYLIVGVSIVKANAALQFSNSVSGPDALPPKDWSQTYGGSSDEYAYSIVQTSDGGFALAGFTDSSGAGGFGFYLVKTDSAGNLNWSQTYGGSGDDFAYSVVQTSDGGYALAGYTNSFGAGYNDFYLVKTDSTGKMQWSKTYGGAGDDEAHSLIKTSDGGYALAGWTDSFEGGGYKFYLVKTDSSGNMLWNNTYGMAGDNQANSIIQTSDGGYALAGSTDSSGAGGNDAYLVKTDAAGNMQWNMTYGGIGDDEAYSIVQTSDGGYALAGYTTSSSVGTYNFWLVKTNSTGAMQWSQTYGPQGEDTDSEAYALVQTTDGGYALGGFTNAAGAGGYDVWLVKTDSNGGVQWSQTYGGTSDDLAYSLIQTSDGGYALAGFTDSSGAGGNDFYLVKVDSAGASGSSASFNWSSVEGYVIIAAVAIIALAVVMLVVSRIGGKKGKF